MMTANSFGAGSIQLGCHFLQKLPEGIRAISIEHDALAKIRANLALGDDGLYQPQPISTLVVVAHVHILPICVTRRLDGVLHAPAMRCIRIFPIVCDVDQLSPERNLLA
jgi:hypothetical protein